MLDITEETDYKKAYERLQQEQVGDIEAADERRFFMSHVDNMSIQMTLFQRDIQQFKNLFVVDSDWLVSSVVRLLEDQIDHTGEMVRLCNVTTGLESEGS